VTNNGSIKFDTAFSLSLSFMERVVNVDQTLAAMVNTADAKAASLYLGNSTAISSAIWFGVPRNADCNGYSTHDATDTTNFIPQPEAWYNLIDNVRLYNRELNSEEIALLAQYYQPTTNSIRQTVSH